MADLKLVHAREFTDIEDVGLTLWNQLQDVGLSDAALQVLDAILMHEHYTSLLDNDPRNRSPGEIKQKNDLKAIADQAIALGRQALQEKAQAFGRLPAEFRPAPLPPPVIEERQRDQ